MTRVNLKSNLILRILFGIILLAWGTAFFAGCDDCDDCNIIVEDDTPPAVPRGLYTITGDEEVYLYWYANQETDFDFYVVYRSTVDLVGPYSEIATTVDPQYVDHNVTNGDTYYYAVTAVDMSLNESDLSYEDVFDTPRPEGYGVRVYDYWDTAVRDSSGFEFFTHSVMHGDNPDADVYFGTYEDVDVFYMGINNINTDIQDYGYTESIDEASWAPTDGWSELGNVEIILGHTYIIWTYDNHFAKIRITDINFGTHPSIKFNWAYQIDAGNPELKIAPKTVTERPAGYGTKDNRPIK